MSPVPGFKEPQAVQIRRARPIRVNRSSAPYAEDNKNKFLRAARLAKFQQYKHGQIKGKEEVRLLMFPKPTNDLPQNQDDIYISLLNVPLRELGQEYSYEALSYHWGHEPAEYPIYFLDSGNGGAHFNSITDIVDLVTNYSSDISKLAYKRLDVRPSLYHALKHLRRQGTGNKLYALWVDAICINQEDEEEKKLQVSLMAEIYSKAYRVCIWLGPGTSQTDTAMDFIRQLLIADDPKDLIEGNHAKSWNNLVTLMTAEWFSRRWVIQELALAREATVHCGTKEVHWDDFRDAISLLGLHVDAIRDLFKNSEEFAHNFSAIGDIDLFGASVLVDVIPNIFRKRTNKTSFEPALGLEKLVSTYSMFDSADPRDTIMAMRNIAKETVRNSSHKFPSQEPPGLDYKKNLFEVYREFVAWVVKTSDSLDILCRHWARPERGEGAPRPPHYPTLVTLPSWILETPKRPKNYTKNQVRLRGDSLVGLPGFASYNASNGLKPSVPWGLDNDETANDGSTTPMTDSSNRLVNASFDTEIQDTQAIGGAILPMFEPLIIANNDVPKGRKRPSDSISGTPNGQEISKRRRDTPPISAPLPRIQTTVHQTQMQSSQTDKSIHVTGLLVEEITWRSDPIADGVIPKIGLEKCGWDLQKYLDMDEEGNTFEIDKVLRTLVADRGADGRSPPTWYHRACLNCLVNHTPNGHMNTKDLLRATQPEFVKQFLKRVQAVTWDRVILETNPASNGSANNSPTNTNLGMNSIASTEKLVGLGPEGTEKGDIVCILFGCSVPVVLRRAKDDKGKPACKFIGEAFIYGKMDGEAISTLTPEELKARTEVFRLI